MEQETKQETAKKLTINSGLACLLRDQEGILDSFDRITVNCGTLIVSRTIYARLTAKNARINTGDITIREPAGPILILDTNTVIDGATDLKGRCVLATGNLIVKGEGLARLAEADGSTEL